MKIQPTFIDVMRHGEPEGSCPEGGTILRGSTDDVLTAKGWLQAKHRCQSIIDASGSDNDGFPWDIIVTSPLLRCADFSEYLLSSFLKENAEKNSEEASNQMPIENTIQCFIKSEWREIHYGDWDGRSTSKIWQEQPEIMEKMWQDPLNFCAPKGEAVSDFSQRIEKAWLDLITEFQGKRILLVCHGGVMRLLLQQLLKMAPEGMNRFAIPYAAMTRFRVDHSLSDEGEPLSWPSLLAHLGEELKEEQLKGGQNE